MAAASLLRSAGLRERLGIGFRVAPSTDRMADGNEQKKTAERRERYALLLVSLDKPRFFSGADRSRVNGPSDCQDPNNDPEDKFHELIVSRPEIQTDPLPLRLLATLCEVTETSTDAITLSPKAVEKIGELLGSQGDTGDQALRVAVRGGGCSGFQYALAFDRVKDDDNVFEVDGVAVVVDKVSMQFVFGSEVDFIEGLQGAGFQVNNPNVVAACGCGSSFQVKDEAAETASV
jgi:iron-sulfur cluster assembly protein